MKIISLTILLLSLFSYVFAQEARKVVEFGNRSCDDLTIGMIDFFDEVTSVKDSKGYIIVYNGKVLRPLYNQQNKTVYPHRNEAKAEIENIKTRIKFYYFDKNRIVFIDGGFREKFTVELWLVPSSASIPKATPTLKTMKYRKGKAEPSCKYI